MKTTDQIKPNYAPVYAAALYPQLAKLIQQHGYALAVHGSLARDFDIVAIPWTESISSVETVLTAITSTFAVTIIGEPQQKNHGRAAYTLSVGFGECAVDLSFIPSKDDLYAHMRTCVHHTDAERAAAKCPVCQLAALATKDTEIQRLKAVLAGKELTVKEAIESVAKLEQEIRRLTKEMDEWKDIRARDVGYIGELKLELAAANERVKRVDETCLWKYDDDADFYETACGQAWCEGEATPKAGECSYKFCPSCGKKVALAAFEKEGE